jgi:hypothetical protein
MSRAKDIAANPAKQLISAKIEHSYLDLEGSLDSAIEELQREKAEYEGKGFTGLNLQSIRDCSCYGHCDCGPRLRLFGSRLETNDEFAKRVELEEQRAAAIEARDRAEFERLSKQFGKPAI